MITSFIPHDVGPQLGTTRTVADEPQYKLIDGATVWKLHATHGFVVECSIPELAKHGYVPTWDKLIFAAAKDGANLRVLVDRLKGIVIDSYPREFALVIREKLPWLIGKEE